MLKSNSKTRTIYLSAHIELTRSSISSKPKTSCWRRALRNTSSWQSGRRSALMLTVPGIWAQMNMRTLIAILRLRRPFGRPRSRLTATSPTSCHKISFKSSRTRHCCSRDSYASSWSTKRSGNQTKWRSTGCQLLISKLKALENECNKMLKIKQSYKY